MKIPFGRKHFKEKNLKPESSTKNIISSKLKAFWINLSPTTQRTEEEQSLYYRNLTLVVGGTIALAFSAANLIYIGSYSPKDFTTVDTSAIDGIKKFIKTENTDKYKVMIERHTNEEKNKYLDIQNVYSSTGRDYPFVPILNKDKDNSSTKVCKFVYFELIPAIKSYHIANGKFPLIESEGATYSNQIDLGLLEKIINIKDIAIDGFEYVLNADSTANNIKITVYKEKQEFPILIFNPTKFKIKELNKNEVNLIYGSHSLVLNPMEEYNNIRLEKIDVNVGCITIVDTITNKIVKITN